MQRIPMCSKNRNRDSQHVHRQRDHHRQDKDIMADANQMMGRRNSSPERFRWSSHSRSPRGRFHGRSRSHRDNRRHGHSKASRSASPSRKYHKRRRRDRYRQKKSSSLSWNRNRSRRGDETPMIWTERGPPSFPGRWRWEQQSCVHSQ